MKILLDENLPKRLKADFADHQVFTARDKGWQGKTNGELLSRMLEESFDVLMTFDKQMRHQQNFEKYPICVLAIKADNNTYQVLKNLVPKLKHILSSPLTIGVTIVSLQNES